jgi:hypothetical protein
MNTNEKEAAFPSPPPGSFVSIRGQLLLFCICLCCSAATKPTDFLYLPPSLADRVVFYQGFELPNAKPEINRIGAEITGSIRLMPDGFAGHACRSNQPKQHEESLQVHSPRLSADRPLTVMRWWRVDSTMEETSCFQLLALLGKGHISCFIRGKGEWCALKRPTMFVQVDHFPSISNVNWAVKDNAYFKEGDWHHTAITVADGSEICFYLDGSPLVTVHIKGRVFTADDINTLQASSDGGDHAEHPTSTDELIVLDRVLSPQEIEQYCIATKALREMQYPPLAGAIR